MHNPQNARMFLLLTKCILIKSSLQRLNCLNHKLSNQVGKDWMPLAKHPHFICSLVHSFTRSFSLLSSYSFNEELMATLKRGGGIQ